MSEMAGGVGVLPQDMADQLSAADPAENDSESIAQRMLQEHRTSNPIASVEKMRMELEKEVVLYALDCLKEQGVIGSGVYESAVKIALKC